jgi:hypothetical protein
MSKCELCDTWDEFKHNITGKKMGIGECTASIPNWVEQYKDQDKDANLMEGKDGIGCEMFREKQ